MPWKVQSAFFSRFSLKAFYSPNLRSKVQEKKQERERESERETEGDREWSKLGFYVAIATESRKIMENHGKSWELRRQSIIWFLHLCQAKKTLIAARFHETKVNWIPKMRSRHDQNKARGKMFAGRFCLQKYFPAQTCGRTIRGKLFQTLCSITIKRYR